ncbi:TetR/AcrR family transcriptional regulator [Candidatus Protofrankia californiensis]|uniref:TetR/AcrR family transcriptional regulator n=1 Tax=Candidatus Protofrankia californiensis TaxID=1839754 RepID=UPI0010412689|nr:TetR/AcrR family transcriptional regulator [Candidatus Protofrankia californiensis]
MPRRPYDNAGRVEQARATQRRVLEAARELIIERGPTAVSMRDIAAHARVSVETLYKTFGTRAALIKDVYDVTLAGDDEPQALADRPEIQAILAAVDPREKLARYAALARHLAERLGPLQSRLRAAAHSGDRDLQGLIGTVDAERLAGTSRLVHHLADTGGLRAGLDPDRARDIVWALISPEVYDLLVGDRRWSHDEYEHWLAQTLADTIAPVPKADRNA